MDNKNQKTAAELYREERKQRMAKAAKKNARKSPQLNKFGRVFGKCLGVVIVAAIVVLIIHAILSFTGTENRVFKTMKIGNKSVSVAKYNYYYLANYYDVKNRADQYDNYYGAGSGKTYIGFDSSKTPKNQMFGGTIEGYANPTWEDYFDYNARLQIQMYEAFADLAKKEGITVTEEQKQEIEQVISTFKSYAQQSDYSLNRYISKRYGNGVNEKLIREIIEEQYLAQNYRDKHNEAIENAITEDEINSRRDEKFKDYAVFGYAVFTISADIPEPQEDQTEEQIAAVKEQAMVAAKEKADGIVANSATLEEFIAQATAYDEKNTADSIVKTNVAAADTSEDLSNWAFEEGRAVGDKTVIKTEKEDGYYVIYLTELPDVDKTKAVDVRHILIKMTAEKDDEGNEIEISDEQKKQYLDEAEKILAEYNQNPTEENFAALAQQYSEDGGSSTNGGLYEGVNKGDMVDEFEDWIFDESRKPGDTGIVLTQFGYHIMYYVGNDHPEKWHEDVKSDIASEKEEQLYESIVAMPEYAVKPKENMIKNAKKQMDKLIKNFITNAAAN